MQRIAIIGFGEAGSILGQDLAARGLDVRTYDILIHDPIKRGELVIRAHAASVRLADSLQSAVEGAELVISAVTALAAVDVAIAAATVLKRDQFFLDINSVSPATKQLNARTIAPIGAAYVEAAVMAPVPPQRLSVPMLLGGARSTELAHHLFGMGMNITVVGDDIGAASAIKMCRSVMIKGLEALTVECLFAARRYGAETEVLKSLARTFPQMGWQGELPDYLISRVAEHGRRRAAEMREVAATVTEGGMEPTMAQAIALRHDALVDSMAQCAVTYSKDTPFSWRLLADALDKQLDASKH